ncbi:MAG TPA: glycosyltransferase family 4 protein [Nocardioides sp.]|uniref:glycosyltransferase family 4 protein n=1 Tax=uncultured Nocardioides sp. TaxID=198441 RepID=UPI000EEB9458|nr:glycosyltransferase family 4 protein [uncultured Nocardioides sp.]HCB03676.1 glycosyl transferase [Nocardioides sp.]HRI97816.1 glycosyltransferase family 4 protein [Nocardioides sp.]
MTVHLVVPSGFAERPSGGNVYDRRVQAGLLGAGWEIATHEVPDAPSLAAVLRALPDGVLVLVDGLVGSRDAELLLAEAGRLSLLLLVHMPFETPREAELLRAAAAVVTTSDWTRRWLLAQYHLDRHRLHVAVPGADIGDPVSGTAGGGELLCLATVIRPKGQDVLLAALAELRDLEWRCTLVGALDLDPDFVTELRTTAADTGIAERVRFAGALRHRDVRAAYAAADALVLPSQHETYGMVVTEALAHGVPVIASSVGGIPEALGHGDDGSRPGWLVPPDDPAALGQALRRWLEDPRRRQRLRRSAALRRLTLPTWSHTTARVASALEAAR